MLPILLAAAAVDGGLLYALSAAGWDPIEAQLLSFACALALAVGLARGSLVHGRNGDGDAPRRGIGTLLLAALLALPLRSGVVAGLLGSGAPAALACAATALTGHAACWLLFFTGFRLEAEGEGEGEGPSVPRAIPVLVGYALLLRLVYAGQLELLHEEAYYWSYAANLDIGYLDHPPLIAWLTGLFTAVLGNTELGVRATPLFGWGVAAWFVYRLGERVFDATTGWAAVLLLAVLPIYFGTGFFLFPDSMLVGCWAGALYYLHRALVEDERRAWVGAGLFVGLALISKYTAALLGPAALAFALSDTKARRWLTRPEPYLAMGLSLLVFSPVLLWNFQNEWASFAFQGPRRLVGEYDFALDELSLFALAHLTPIGVIALVVGWRARGELERAHADAPDELGSRSLRLLGLSVLVPLAVMCSFALFRSFRFNWLSPLWIGGLPLIAHFVVTRAPEGAGRLRRLVHGSWPATVLLLLLAYGLALHYLTLGIRGVPYPVNELGGGWREAAARIERIADDVETETGKRPLVVGMDTDRINSWISFYRQAIAANGNGERAAVQAGGPSLFGWGSRMYEYWFPRDAQNGRDLILVGDSKHDLVSEDVERCVSRGTEIRLLETPKNGQPAVRVYYRVVYGYRGDDPGCPQG